MRKLIFFIWIIITLMVLNISYLKCYSIKGNVIGIQDGTRIYLLKYLTDEYIDSAIVNQSNFNMHGSLDIEPELYILTTDAIGHHDNSFYLANDDIQVFANLNEFPKRLKVVGSKTNDEKIDLDSRLKNLYDRRIQLVSDYYSLPDKENNPKGKNIWDTIATIDKKYTQVVISFIRNNPDSYISIIHLDYEMRNLQKDSIKAIFNSLTAKLQNSSFAKSIINFLNDKVLKIGDNFIDFQAYNNQNEKVKLSDFKGNYILLDFTSYSCSPCRASVKELKEVLNEYGRNIEIISFYVDYKRNDWLNAINRDSINWSSLWEGSGMKSETCIKYDVQSVPTFVLIHSGKIIDKWTGYGNGLIKKHLKEKIQ
jgi:thiol-disulfide isomerase/thioredoxin